MKCVPAAAAAWLACAIAHAADPVAADVYGVWTFDAALSAAHPSDMADASAATAAPAGAPRSGGRHGGAGGHGMGGGMGSGMGSGMGHGGGMGSGHGGHHDGSSERSQHAAATDAAAQERALSRVRATRLTISAQPQRIRFDDGEHPVELPRDGMNLSGAGIGGTVALSATSPDLVVESLTDAGTSVSERYHLADDGKHLELHVRVKAADAEQARETVRVFDRDGGIAGAK